MKTLLLSLVLLVSTTGCADLFDAAAFAPPDADVQENEWTVDSDSAEASTQPLPETDPLAFDPVLPRTPVTPGPRSEPRQQREAPDPARFRADVVDLVNQVRATGADCGEHGAFAPAGPMSSNSRLRVAAEHHTHDMATHDFLAHEGSDGHRFWDRASDAGYTGTPRGENVAGGYPTPESVVEAWLASDGHCMVLMLPETDEIGVGYQFDGDTEYGHFWAMVTGIR